MERAPRRARRALIVLAVLLLAGSLAGALGLYLRPSPPRARNVLLVTVDTLRADALGCSGGKSETPYLDALASAGVRFTFAHAHSVVTLPSHVNILTGLMPYQHGVRDNSGFAVPSGVRSLATMLRERGWRTAAFVGAAPLDARFGLNRGFEVYDEGYPESRGEGQPLFPERPGTAVVASALSWLGPVSNGDKPWLCWVHLFDPHAPYEPPEPFRSRFAGRPYFGEVAAADAALGPLLALARAQPHTLVVLTSDHGESLGEHGEQTHGLFCYESTLHVPLLLYAPELLDPAVREETVGHVDIVPTVLDALGLGPAPPELQGRSLLEARAAGSEVYFESMSAMLNRGWAPLRGLLAGREKWIELPLPELYELASDPAEARNLYPGRDGAELRARLLEQARGDRVEAGERPDRELEQRLEALGYLTSKAGPKATYSEEDDPKRLIGVDAKLQEAIALYQRGRVAEAIDLYERLVAERPKLEVAYAYLAFLRYRQGELGRAVATLERAVQAGLRSLETRTLLAGYLAEAGRPAEGAALLEGELARDPPDVDALNVLGMALAGAGDAAQALLCFKRILEADPGNARALLNAATVHLQGGSAEQARPLLEQAVAADPTMAEAWNTLGVLEAQGGRPEAAIADWKKAVALDPRLSDTLYNLGLLLHRLGRKAEARPYLEAYLADRRPAAEDRLRVQSLLADP